MHCVGFYLFENMEKSWGESLPDSSVVYRSVSRVVVIAFDHTKYGVRPHLLVANSQTVYTRDSFVVDKTWSTFARAKSPDEGRNVFGTCGSRFNFHDRAPYTLVDATRMHAAKEM